MTEIQNPKRYDLEERTIEFIKAVIRLCKRLSRNTTNIELTRQLIKSAGSVSANYREANESISKKDLNFRIRISRKEAKESHFWLQGLLEANPEYSREIESLIYKGSFRISENFYLNYEQNQIVLDLNI